MSSKLVRMVKRHENYSAKPYVDTTGHLTVGYGRNLEDNPLTEPEATYLLVTDLDRCERELERRWPVVKRLDAVRRAALVDMTFNLGIAGIAGFSRMWAAIERGDWERAYMEALDSKWSAQVGRRSLDIAAMLATGEWDDDADG